MPSWIVHRVCRCVLYVATTFCLSVHPSYINGAERRARNYGPDMEQRSQELGWDIVLPFSAISRSNSCWQRFSIHTSTLMSLAPEENLKRPGTRCGWCPHTVCLQQCLMHSDFDGPQVLSTAILAPCLESVPASLVWALVTHQIWTNSGRAHHKLCAYAWWLHTCTLKVILINLPAGCSSCEHSFPPPAFKFCPQPSWLTFDSVLIEKATFRVPTFLISEMCLWRYGQKSQLFVNFIQMAYWQRTQKTATFKNKRTVRGFYSNENLWSSEPPPIVKRSDLGGSWKRFSEKKKYFLQTKGLSCPSHSRPSDFLSCHYFQCWEQRTRTGTGTTKKKVAIPVFIREFGKYIQKKFNKYVNIES